MDGSKLEGSEGPIKVSDWSQKYKLALYVISIIIISYIGIEVISILNQIKNILYVIAGSYCR